MMRQIEIGITFTFLIKAATGIDTSGMTCTYFIDGELQSDLSVTAFESVEGWYKVTIPALEVTGVHSFILFDQLFEVECTSRSVESYLKDICDVATGSWNLDKTTGTLTLYRTNGVELSVFQTADTSTAVSRTLVS